MDKELDEVDLSNYIAFFGCSFTVGIGLPLTYTFAYKSANQLNVDYVNGAVSGSSCDYAFHNIVKLISTAKIKPKAIIINWPEITRTFYWKNNTMEFYLVNADLGSYYWKNAYRAFLMEESHLYNRFEFIRSTVKLLCSAFNIRLFEFTTYQSDLKTFLKKYPDIGFTHIVDQENKLDPTSVEYLNNFSARDVLTKNGSHYGYHPGIYFHNQATKQIVEWFNNV
jgi:hypothetical protein